MTALTDEEIAADLASEEEQRSADRKLLAEVLHWSRAHGYDKAREYESGRFAGYSWKAPYEKLHLDPHGDPTLYYEGHAIQPETVREAVDVLCALGALPQEKFSSAFQAGRESAYTRDEWRVCSGPANKQLPEEFQFPYICADEIETAEEAALELSRARVTWANEDSWIEYRRTGATEWQRVDQVGERQQYEAVADGR